MRSTFKVLFYVNGSKEKNGIVPIMGRVTINGSVAQFSCKLTIAKTMWDAKGNRAKGKSKEARDINLALDNIKAQIIKHHIVHPLFGNTSIYVFKQSIGVTEVLVTTVFQINLDYVLIIYSLSFQIVAKQIEKQIRLTATADSGNNLYHSVVHTPNEFV